MDTAPETAQHTATTNEKLGGQRENLSGPSSWVSSPSTRDKGKRRDVSSPKTDEDEDDGSWRTYPEILSDIDPVLEDARFWRGRLAEVGKAFCSEPEDSIRVLDIGSKGKSADEQSESPGKPRLTQRIHSQLRYVAEPTPPILCLYELLAFKIVPAVGDTHLALTLHSLLPLLSASQISPNILSCILQRTDFGTKVHFMNDESDEVVRERKSYPLVFLSSKSAYVTSEPWFSLPLPAEDSSKHEIEQSTFWLDYAPATGLSDFLYLEIRRKIEKKLHRIKDMRLNRPIRASDFTLLIFEYALEAWRDAVHVAGVYVLIAVSIFDVWVHSVSVDLIWALGIRLCRTQFKGR